MQLNIRLNTEAVADTSASDALKDASKRKQASNETLDEAWVRILSGKHSDSDLRKLHEVKRAMSEGIIGREPLKVGKKSMPKFSKAEALRIWSQLSEMQRESKLAELVANTPSNYVLVTDVGELKALVDRAMNEPIIAVDTETTGLDVYVDVIVGVSLTLPIENVHYYIPFEPTNDERALPAEHIEILRPLIEGTSVKKVLHNALYDMAMFRRHGIELLGVAWDTQHAMHMLNENESDTTPNKPYALKHLATKYLKEPSDTFGELFGRGAKFAEIPLDIALVYGAKDTDLTWRLYEFQSQHLAKYPEMYEYYTTVEVALLYVILDLEENGYILDLDFAKQYGQQLAEQAESLKAWIIEFISPYHEGEDVINLNSGQQMKPALSKAIGKELPNLDAKRTLKPLKDKHEVIAKLLEYKRITKLSGTYIDTLPTKQHPKTKRWHSRFNPMGTVTARFSSGKDDESSVEQFNVQNQPYDARKMFVAPKGKVLVSADFKAQEIRCVASMSQEPALLEAFKLGRDPYAMLAMQYTGLPYEQVNKNPDGSDTEWRKKMKVAWLAWLYGASDFTLGDWLGTTKTEAGKFMGELKESLPTLSAWLDGNVDFVKRNGYVWMHKNQRKRRLPAAKWKRKFINGDYNDPKFATERIHNGKISGALRMATNARVQGSSAIQTKVTMVKSHEYCKTREGWALWATVHDELIFEIPDDFTREDIEAIRKLMTDSYTFEGVENGTDIEVMTVWGEGMTPTEWFKSKEETG